MANTNKLINYDLNDLETISALFDQLSVPAFITDHNHKLTHANQAYNILSNTQTKKIIGQDYRQFFSISDCPNYKKNSPQKHEVKQLKTATGKIYLEHIFLIKHNGDKFYHHLHILEDYTKVNRLKKEVSFEQQRLAKRYKELNLLYKLAMLILDPHKNLTSLLTKIIKLIPAAYQYPKITAVKLELPEYKINVSTALHKKVKGKEDHQFSPIMYNDKEIGMLCVCYLKKMPLEEEGPFFIEERALINTIAKVISFTIKLHETTCSLESQAKKEKTILNEIKDGIIMANNRGLITYTNKAAHKIFGYSKTEMVNLNVQTILRPMELHKKAQKELTKFLKTGQGPITTTTIKTKAIKKEGDEIYLELSISTLKLKNQWNALLVTRDITAQKKVQDKLKLSKVFAMGLEAISYAIEVRDPYTAGHQKRVATLAKVIAADLGLSADQQEEIYLGASVHDIGKINIPAEILSCPRQLTTAEYELIKTHPEAGYEILKKTNSPQSVLNIILLHHERLNGSGYPFGFTARKIPIEVRIVSVADAVEAMHSHRPYRTQHTMKETLSYIEKNKGKLFDTKVVESCVRLIKSGKFVFPRWKI